VAKQLFDVVKIGSAPDQLGGAGTAERVRAHVHVEALMVSVAVRDAQESMIAAIPSRPRRCEPPSCSTRSDPGATLEAIPGDGNPRFGETDPFS
jgi:hypothetical protein